MLAGVYEVNVSGDAQSEFAWCERLYEAKAAQLLLYGRALGLSHGESEDVLHETFAALMQRIQPPEQPDHYVIRAFRNRALNYRRSLWRRLTRELESARWFERSEGETPAERAAMRCLASLPPDQREVIVLKIWNRCTFEMIGELLALSPNTAAGRYRYGLQKLKAQLRGKDYEALESLERRAVGESFGVWQPRRPSPNLSERLFGHSPSASSESPSLVFWTGWRWLVPAFGCFVMTLAGLGPRSDPFGHWSAPGTSHFFAAVMSNQIYAAYLTAPQHSEQNALGREILEWTVTPRANSNDTSFRWAQTNTLLH